jgi:hypothetical protein
MESCRNLQTNEGPRFLVIIMYIAYDSLPHNPLVLLKAHGPNIIPESGSEKQRSMQDEALGGWTVPDARRRLSLLPACSV